MSRARLKRQWGLDSHGGHWTERARCARPDVDPEWFWPASSSMVSTRLALSVCERCHVTQECGDAAAADPVPFLRIAGGKILWPRTVPRSTEPTLKRAHSYEDVLAFIDVRPYGTVRWREMAEVG